MSQPSANEVRAPFFGDTVNSESAQKQRASIRALVVVLLRGFIAPAEVLLRRQVGERYFAAGILVVNLIILLIMGVFMQPIGGYFLWVLPILFIGMSYHTFICYYRDRSGGYWHSYSVGVSRLQIPILNRYCTRKNHTFDPSKLIVEPIVLFLGTMILGLFVGGGTNAQEFARVGPSGMIFVALISYYNMAAIGLVIYESMSWSHYKQKLLDYKDSQVIANAKIEAQKRPAVAGVEHYQGVAIAPAPQSISAPAWTN